MRSTIRTTIAPSIEPMMPTRWNLCGASRWYWIWFQMNPPTTVAGRAEVAQEPQVECLDRPPVRAPAVLQVLLAQGIAA
jgi:hypothetical protein